MSGEGGAMVWVGWETWERSHEPGRVGVWRGWRMEDAGKARVNAWRGRRKKMVMSVVCIVVVAGRVLFVWGWTILSGSTTKVILFTADGRNGIRPSSEEIIYVAFQRS